MPDIKANGIQLEYDTFGDSSSSPLLLVMGLGAQMVRWEVDFCNELAKNGHYVIRFDNRDVGLSTKFEDAGVPDILEAMAAMSRQEEVKVPYTIEDMADDGVGLLDALGIDKANICGASMGGMIVQAMAIRHPSRISSMVSIMSTTGNRELPGPEPNAMGILLKPSPTERDKYIEYMVTVRRTIGSPGFKLDEDLVRKRAAEDYDRGFYPDGTARQLLAVLTQNDRTEALGSVKTPTLVIHGVDDNLVPVEGGKATAKAIPGAELMLIDGMGHDLPLETWPDIVSRITKLTKGAKA